MFLAK